MIYLQKLTTLKNNEYQVIRVLGSGGFGITYLVKEIATEKFFAMKEFFPKDYCSRSESTSTDLVISSQFHAEFVSTLKRRFLIEARNIATFNYIGIVKVYDIFEENNTIYSIMEFIDGQSLQQIVSINGPLSQETALRYVIQVAEALNIMHNKNMAHLDVKPSNIMVRKTDNYAILIDFGLSKKYDHSGIATSTMIGAASPSYSPLELYSSTDLPFSPKVDIYSLGATLYFLLTGTHPPTAPELAVKELEFSSHIPQSIQTTIRKAMSTSSTGRHESIASFLNQLTNNATRDTKVNTTLPIREEKTTQLGTKTINLSQSKNRNISSGSKYVKSKKFKGGLIVAVIAIICLLTYFLTPLSQNLSKSSEVSTNELDIDSSNMGLPPIALEDFYNDTSIITKEVVTDESDETLIGEKQIRNKTNQAESRKIVINENGYRLSVNATVDNGKLTTTGTLNGESQNGTLECSKNVYASQILDQFEAFYYFDAATVFADNIVELGGSSEYFLDLTIKYLQKTKNLLGPKRGNCPIALEKSNAFLNDFKEYRNSSVDCSDDIEISAWGMSEHPIKLTALKGLF